MSTCSRFVSTRQPAKVYFLLNSLSASAIFLMLVHSARTYQNVVAFTQISFRSALKKVRARMNYLTNCTDLSNSPTRYTTRIASKHRFTLLFCVAIQKYWHLVFFYETGLQFFSKKLQSYFFAHSPRPYAHANHRNSPCVAAVLRFKFFAFIVFEAPATYESYQPNSTSIASS